MKLSQTPPHRTKETHMAHETCCGPVNVESAVRERYSAAAQQAEPALCCAVSYDERFLKAIPEEILERDYGCGDPSKHLQAGETVLDLGSGGGKICYIAAQVVGATGRVIGVDCNDEMLMLARKYQRAVSDRLGFHNVEFRKGKIQDLQLDLERFERYLTKNPVRSSSDWLSAEEHATSLRQREPLIAANSIDVVVSNCVLNLVRSDDRRQLFNEIFRVLKPGGRAVISDIVSSDDVPAELQADPRLWSGCISGAFREDRFLAAFESAGFHGVEILERQEQPWTTIGPTEFRSVTVRAFKPLPTTLGELRHAVIYRGPWKSVATDFRGELSRGQRVDVRDAEFAMLSQPPYRDQLILLPNENLESGIAPSGATLTSLDVIPSSSGSCCSTGSKCC